jgi:hypothetical protein
MITMSKLAYDKSLAITKAYDQEIIWYGYITKHGQNITVHDIYVPIEQNTSSASVTSHIQGEEKLLDWVDEMSKTIPGGWAGCRCHSHVNMSTSPSNQDINQIKTSMKDGAEFCLGLIFNKKGEVSAQLGIYGHVLFMDEIHLEDVYGSWAEKIAKQVRTYNKSLIPLPVNNKETSWKSRIATVQEDADDTFWEDYKLYRY